MKKATVHIFSPLHMSIILEMNMAKPALHKDESTSSPMRKSMSLKKNKQNQSKIKRPKGLGAPLCWNSSYSILTFFFFCFQSASRLLIFVLVYAEIVSFLTQVHFWTHTIFCLLDPRRKSS